MVRGVNKRVIEINETGNPYFDKAVLYMNDRAQKSEPALEEEARRYLATIQRVRWSGWRPWKAWARWLLWLLLGAGAGLLLWGLLLLL